VIISKGSIIRISEGEPVRKGEQEFEELEVSEKRRLGC